jgi:hypothetical protein
MLKGGLKITLVKTFISKVGAIEINKNKSF